MYGQPIYSDGRASDPVQREPGARFLAALRADPPAGQTDNRFLQSQRYTGVPYAAINAVLSLVEGCTYSVVRRKRKRTAKSLFLPGHVYKGTPTPHAHAHDEAYTPFEDVGHPLAAMVTHPNNEQTFGELTGDLVLQNRLTGVGPLWAVPNTAGRPVELWALKTALTYPLASISQRYPQGAWRVTPFASAGWAGTMPTGLSAAGAVIPGEEVKRFRDRHPLIDWDGFSPLTAEARQLDILEAIDESRWSAMTNGLQLDAVLTVPGADQGALDRLSAQMTAKSGGSRNARKFLALATAPGGGPGDKANLQTFGTAPRDMDFSQGWQQMTDFCLACFGVTSAAVGLKESTSYSELYASLRQFFWRQGQFVRRLADFYTRVLCRPWESFADEFRIQIDLPTLDDQELIDKRLGNDVNRISLNEARGLRNMPPVEGGDVPEAIYLKWLEQKVLPQPEQQQPGADPGQGGQGGQDSDPLSAILGGTPTGGAVPGEGNDDAEGTLPPRESVGKSMGELTGSGGGFLVPPTAVVRRRRRKLRGCIRKALDRLGE